MPNSYTPQHQTAVIPDMAAIARAFPIIGFDLDGTFADTSGDLLAATNYALGQAGRAPLLRRELRPMVGGGAKVMLEAGLRRDGGTIPANFDELHHGLVHFYENHIAITSTPFPGALAVLDAFDAAGIRYGIVTNKYERLAVQLIDALSLSHRFGCIIGGDTMGPGKAKPNAAPIHEMIRRLGGTPGQTGAAFVGDSMFDVMAAHNAGIPAIACSFGFLSQPVEELGADVIIDQFSALIPALHGLTARQAAR